jgi:hypothetical protein
MDFLFSGQQVQAAPVQAELFAERIPKTDTQLGTELSNLHPGHDNELAAQHLARFIVIRQLGLNAAVLTVLVPAKTAVGDRFGAQELKTAQQRILVGNFHGLTQHLDFNQVLVGPERAGHNRSFVRGTCSHR